LVKDTVCEGAELVESLAFEDDNEFDATLLFGREAVVDVDEGVVLLVAAASLPHVEYHVATLKL
jgi:hypothetical protein